MTTETKTAPKADDSKTVEQLIEEGVAYYEANSTFNPQKNERIIKKAVFDERMEVAHGISPDTLKKVTEALNFETTVASELASHDAVRVIEGATPEQRADDVWRRKTAPMVRLPTAGGNTELTCNIERYSINPLASQQPDAPTHITSHGRIGIAIRAKGRIDRGCHDRASERIKAALGM